MSSVRFENVTCAFGSVTVLDRFSLQVHPGEFVAIVGPSGCGKTTLLNLIAGNLAPTSGSVAVDGNTRTVYQQDGLFPWRTVRENILLGLQHLSTPEERERAITEILALIGLENFGGHYPHELSGGMKQRTELARALVGRTDILLMDEPFSSLDYLTRLKLRQELSRMLAERPRTVVLVTHDIEEAAQLADRIVVLTARPTRISREAIVDLPRPRNATAPAVVATMHTILSEMGIEDSKP
ncbi:MAG: ABC transporter ATP-binding protein [Capsulimonadales bacterium]|nr:ABC transporter ATP-binding protein [Capsulimonadales bacterium]